MTIRYTVASPVASLSVAELLRRAGDGDRAAWEEIMRRFRGTVIRTVRSFRLQDADAHDAMQMTWLRLAENCHHIQFPEYLGGWLATVASRECLRIVRASEHTPNRDSTEVENMVAFSSLQITGIAVSVVLAVLAGLGVRPLVTWMNRRVEGVFYGERARPYEVLRALAARLRDGLSPAEVPETVCRTVVHTLRLPAAALVAQTRHGPRRLAMVGASDLRDLNEAFELRYRGSAIGQLWVRRRKGQPELDALDRTVLQSLADQAAPAVAGLRLLEDLQASRERLVAAREEERRRLRRDLHDGIGPTLAGIRLQLDTARAALPADSPASGLLRQVGSDIGAVVAELRLVTDSLRPPALDHFGLAGAVRELVNRLSSPALPFNLSLPCDLSGLPAAVEVALYRILAEALTNVISHAGASHAEVQIALDEDTVRLDVVDDGAGLPSTPRPDGIGLTSMRERTQEIGGQCVIATVPEGGTRVHVTLPRALATTVATRPQTGSLTRPPGQAHW